jgi:hypothetical protein
MLTLGTNFDSTCTASLISSHAPRKLHSRVWNKYTLPTDRYEEGTTRGKLLEKELLMKLCNPLIFSEELELDTIILTFDHDLPPLPIDELTSNTNCEHDEISVGNVKMTWGRFGTAGAAIITRFVAGSAIGHVLQFFAEHAARIFAVNARPTSSFTFAQLSFVCTLAFTVFWSIHLQIDELAQVKLNSWLQVNWLDKLP